MIYVYYNIIYEKSNPLIPHRLIPILPPLFPVQLLHLRYEVIPGKGIPGPAGFVKENDFIKVGGS
jgi:hypothetical protein